MNIREILESWLREHGYDGLYCDGCGCRVDDLMPCDSPQPEECRPGFIVQCNKKCDDYVLCVAKEKNTKCPYGHDDSDGGK
ncbi:MAG: hypothetical protein WC455_16710 [Dehalococcoidia bacterium]|jgi:hypothetical protein